MHAKVRNYISPDVPDLLTYHPPDPEDFELLVQVLVGPDGGEGGETFYVIVLTPKRLSAKIAAQGPSLVCIN